MKEQDLTVVVSAAAETRLTDASFCLFACCYSPSAASDFPLNPLMAADVPEDGSGSQLGF